MPAGGGEEEAIEYLDEEDPNLVDLNESIDYDDSEPNRWNFDGDLRGGFFANEVDERDGTTSEHDEFTIRIRYGANFGLTDNLRIRGRLAMVCGTEACDPNLDIDQTPANGTNVNGGDIVLDELYVHLFQQERLDLIAGRLQTNANTRGGVFISSLSRMTSPNVSVNWTDGLAGRYRFENGWAATAVIQYNDEDGSSTLARPPLDFSDDGSRVSYFAKLESRERLGPFTQRAIDVTYLPDALLTDSDQLGPVRDYWAVVGRLATEMPLQEGRGSIITSGELGYAPETQSKSGAGFSGSGDVDGTAWHVEVSWMNFRPSHSLGINYGQAAAGWLISPVYRSNDETVTLRYHWRPVAGMQLELHTRWRKDLERFTGAERRKTFDLRARLTWVIPG